ncbi:MAG TPA: S8 family serine peptidase [Pedomonas sp.]|uniref:S8 family serine peptidase n=1 Tax=Pedomonas sp. TaxID=2976421 RepID=UPI002F4189F9
MARSYRRITLLFSALTMGAGDGHAQLLPPLGGVPDQVLGGVLGAPANTPVVVPVIDRLNTVGGSVTENTASLLELRRARLRALIRDNRRVLESDRDGNPVRKGEIIALDPSADTMARARAAGFRLLRHERIESLNLHVVTFGPPDGEDTRDGLAQLRRIAPEGVFDFHHVFEPAGGALMSQNGAAAVGSASSGRPAIGMIDGGVSNHPSLRDAAIEQRGFAAKGAQPSGHGTAVASLMVGSDGRFQGAARGVSLLVADVYGGDPAEGSAAAIAHAIGWLTSRGVRVINMSLVGPANPLLERAIAAARRSGVLIVAAVGNDGPAAPPSYPASYSGVVAVTGVDARNRALPEAGKALHLDFAAPGADMAAALPGSGYATVRGTSFAAPFVTSRLVMTGDAASPIEALSREVTKGRGKIGRGIVCGSCRISPRDVGARR